MSGAQSHPRPNRATLWAFPADVLQQTHSLLVDSQELVVMDA